MFDSMTEKTQLVLLSMSCILSLLVFGHIATALFVAVLMIIGIIICIIGERDA